MQTVGQSGESGLGTKGRVFVPDAHAIGMIGVIRSLWRAGYIVWAGSSEPYALGLRSRGAHRSVLYPDYSREEFVPWFDEFLADNAIAYIIPSEGLLLAIKPYFERYRKLFPLAPPRDLLYRAFSKASVLEEFIRSGVDSAGSQIPPTVILSGTVTESEVDLQSLSLPIYVKADAVDCKKKVRNGVVYAAHSERSAINRATELSDDYEKVVLQGCVDGVGVGVYFLIHEGSIVAEFMNRCVHEVPHTGGFCSLRESWFHKEIYDDALRKALQLRWSGVIMLEYKWDERSGDFFFIEVNARFWAALHLALFSGVDFPRMLMGVERGDACIDTSGEPRYVRSRISFPYEVGYVLSRIRDEKLPLSKKSWAVVEYFLLLLDPKVKDDLWFAGDRALFFHSFAAYARSVIRTIARRLGMSRHRNGPGCNRSSVR